MSVLGDVALGLGRTLVSQELQAYANQLNNQLNSLNAPSQLTQQNLLNAAQQANYRSLSLPICELDIARAKLNAQMHELVRQIPMSIAGKIVSCSYFEQDPEEAARFVLVFTNHRQLTFYDVDNFPSGEHIGRIALECP